MATSEQPDDTLFWRVLNALDYWLTEARLSVADAVCGPSLKRCRLGAEDLGQGDLVKIDCAACHHVALLTPEALLKIGLSPAAKVLDLKGRLRCVRFRGA